MHSEAAWLFNLTLDLSMAPVSDEYRHCFLGNTCDQIIFVFGRVRFKKCRRTFANLRTSYIENSPISFPPQWTIRYEGGLEGPCAIYHIPSENVPLKSEIFTKNVKEWPIEILNVNRKCPIIKILILITGAHQVNIWN